jgi:hypothetical protein
MVRWCDGARKASRAAGILALAGLMAGCGDFVRQGNAGGQVVILALEAASGATPDEFGGTLNSDVVTIVTRTVGQQQVQSPTVFNDIGRVTMTLILRDPGVSGSTNVPSPINQVTFTRYRVEYRRSDGRNTPGVDVPHPYDSAATFTVPASGQVVAGFEIVRHIAKEEAPLLALRSGEVIISTIATVTFFGKDQAGNDVRAAGRIGINFGNFGDPT